MPDQTYRILIVDDSPEDREVYQRFLSRGHESDYQFSEACSAEEALRVWQEFKPDCVLLDYRLPGADGLDLLERFENHNHVPISAIVMLTGQGDEVVAVEAMKTGAHDYLVKSKLTREALRRSVHNAIEKVRLQREIAEKQKQLERLATLDSLTNLYNRRYFMERLNQELSRTRRYHTSFSVMMMDVDHFKKVNDTFGHSVGDEVLIRVGEVLHSCLRGSDLAARYGGEEFCVLAANTDAEGAHVFADRVRQLIAEQVFRSEGKPSFSITCSIGIAEATDADDDARKLLDRADDAMYEAKRAGRNRVCVWQLKKEGVTK